MQVRVEIRGRGAVSYENVKNVHVHQAGVDTTHFDGLLCLELKDQQSLVSFQKDEWHSFTAVKEEGEAGFNADAR